MKRADGKQWSFYLERLHFLMKMGVEREDSSQEDY